MTSLIDIFFNYAYDFDSKDNHFITGGTRNFSKTNFEKGLLLYMQSINAIYKHCRDLPVPFVSEYTAMSAQIGRI